MEKNRALRTAQWTQRRQRSADTAGASAAALEQTGGSPRQSGGKPPHSKAASTAAMARRAAVPLPPSQSPCREGRSRYASAGWSRQPRMPGVAEETNQRAVRAEAQRFSRKNIRRTPAVGCDRKPCAAAGQWAWMAGSKGAGGVPLRHIRYSSFGASGQAQGLRGGRPRGAAPTTRHSSFRAFGERRVCEAGGHVEPPLPRLNPTANRYPLLTTTSGSCRGRDAGHDQRYAADRQRGYLFAEQDGAVEDGRRQ